MALQQNEDRINFSFYGDLARNIREAAEKRFLSPQNFAKMVLGEYLTKRGKRGRTVRKAKEEVKGNGS